MILPWFAAYTADEASQLSASAGLLRGEFQTREELVNTDPRCSVENLLFGEIDQPGVGRVRAPRAPLQFGETPTAALVPAPSLVGDTGKVLADVFGKSRADIARLQAGALVE